MYNIIEQQQQIKINLFFFRSIDFTMPYKGERKGNCNENTFNYSVYQQVHSHEIKFNVTNVTLELHHSYKTSIADWRQFV